MLSQEVEIRNKRGLHARAAAKFATLASQFVCAVNIRKGQHVANGKSIMGIMVMAAAKGTRIHIFTDGEDEARALQALVDLVYRGFDEEE